MRRKGRAAICCLASVCFAQAPAQESPLRQAARLDTEQRCAEAELLYQKALGQGAPSQPLLNNLGNHYLICGDPEKARTYFERLQKLNPAHANANLHLARLAVDRHEGGAALEYLARVTDQQPATRMLRAEALHLAGKQAAALAILEELQKERGTDPALIYLFGITCARVGAYDRATEAFESVLTAHPGDPEVLYNLGRAAARAGQYQRAEHALEAAVKLDPKNVDALVELAEANTQLRDFARAVYLLVQARQMAPSRPEIALALARAAQGGEYYGDAALAYDEYLRLKPNDEEARRDRALVVGFTTKGKAEGLKEIKEYTLKHPGDPVGFFNLAQLVWRDNPQKAVEALNAAVRLDPKFGAAQVDLAWLLNRQGRTAEAVPHLRKALEVNTKDVRALDQLGAAYISLDRPSDAESVLRRAVSIAPQDSEVLMHLGRALMESGHEEEAQEFLSRFQKLRSTTPARRPWNEPAMIRSAGLPAAERIQQDIERLRKDAADHADDPQLELNLACLLFTAGKTGEAEAEFRVLLRSNAETKIWSEAGNFLLANEQFVLSRQFLERAAAADASVNLDLATAVFHEEGPESALKVLDNTPADERPGDYWLIKAKILDAAGRSTEGTRALETGLHLPVGRPQVVKDTTLLIVQHDRGDAALEFLEKNTRGDPDLLLTRAMLLTLVNRQDAAEKALKDIEAAWPEWDRPYVVHGLLVEKSQPKIAKQKIETALALGSQELSARCALARMAQASGSAPECSCAGSIRDMLFTPCSTGRRANRQ
jgi:Flp pilus assembly protein TadD